MAIVACLVLTIIHTVSKENIKSFTLNKGDEILFFNENRHIMISFIIREIIASVVMVFASALIIAQEKDSNTGILIAIFLVLSVFEIIKIIFGTKSLKRKSSNSGRAFFTIGLFQLFIVTIWMLIVFVFVVDYPIDLLTIFILILNMGEYVLCQINVIDYCEVIVHKKVSTNSRV